MAFKKVSKEFWVAENEGDTLTGVVRHGGTVNTEHGEADYVTFDVVNIDGKGKVTHTGEKMNVIVSGGLQPLYDNVDKLVRLTYEGEKKNPKSKRTFKSYSIEVDDEYTA